MRLVLVAQSREDRHGLLDRRLADQDGLEAALEGGVLLDVLAVLVERRRADALELAAGKHRLHHVGRVHRALGRARADHGVQLVDEEDHVLGALDLVEGALEALLELAAILRPGDHAAEVERKDALVAQRFGDVAVHDLLREPFGDRRLADPRLADDDRVVLRAAAQHLDDALDLLVAADDRVELVVASERREVARVLAEHALARRLPFVVHAAGADLLQSAHDALLGDTEVAKAGAAGAVALEQDAEQQVLRADEGVAHRLRLLAGVVERGLRARRQVELIGVAAGAAGAACAGGLQVVVGARHGRTLVDAEQIEDLLDDAARQAEHADQQVFGAELVARPTAHDALRRLERLTRAL